MRKFALLVLAGALIAFAAAETATTEEVRNRHFFRASVAPSGFIIKSENFHNFIF
jgi:hypothetical protein